MSINGYWPAVSGSKAIDHHVQVVSNNLANVNTVGFKRDDLTFQQYLDAQQSATVADGIPSVKGSPEQLYPLDGKNQQGVRIEKGFIDLQAGKMQRTGNPLDLAIGGQGFFEVATPEGVLLTRSGNFQVDNQGRLVTVQGYPVLGRGEGIDRAVNVGGQSGPLSFASDGTISVNGVLIGQLSVVQPQDPQKLEKRAGTFFKSAETSVASDPRIEQGFLESSNVNGVKELTELMRLQRAFEATQQAVKNINDLQQKSASQISRF